MRTPLVIACALATSIGPAGIIDRVAVSVGNQVITESRIDEDIRVTAFLNQTAPDFSREARREAADRLVDQLLIRREMESSGYPLPAASEADEPEKDLIARLGGQAAYEDALTRYSVTRDQVRRQLWWQVTILRFIDYRFRPAVQAPQSAILAEYNRHVEEWKARGETNIPSFEDSRAAMEQVVLEQRANQALDFWLGEARKQVAITYHEDAFQ